LKVVFREGIQHRLHHLNFLKMAAIQLYLQSGKQRKAGLVGDDSHVAFNQTFPNVKRSVSWCVVVMQQPLSVAKVRKEIFAHFHAVAVERHRSIRN
jgi:hypothetical protein